MLTIYLFLILIIISALFSSGESALFSLSNTQKNQLASNRTSKKRGKRLLKWLNEPEKTLSAILLGNLTTNILISNLGYSLIDSYTRFSQLETTFISLIIITIILLIFAEIIPKILALQLPIRWSLMIFPFLRVWFVLSYYFVQPIHHLMRQATSRLSNFDKKYKEKELLNSVLLASSYNLIKEHEKNTLQRTIIFYHDVAFQTMIPRSQVFMIPHNISTIKIKKAFLENNHQFSIVYHATTKKLLGYLHIKGLIVLLHKRLKSVTSKVQDVLFLPETIPLDQALKNMIQEKTEVAAIVDESGEFSGILTLKNLLKKLMGNWEVGDEFESGLHESIKKIDSQVYRVKGFLKLNQFNDFFNLDLEHKKIETISGYIIDTLDGFPKNSTTFQIENLHIYNIRMDENRLDSFLVKILDDPRN